MRAWSLENDYMSDLKDFFFRFKVLDPHTGILLFLIIFEELDR